MVDVNDIIDYETGQMSDARMVQFFAQMVKDGTVWSLQGHYGRTADYLLQHGVIARDGRVLIDLEDLDPEYGEETYTPEEDDGLWDIADNDAWREA